MAKVVIQREFPDSDEISVLVEVDASYPDALAEAKRVAIDTYAEVLAISLGEPEAD